MAKPKPKPKPKLKSKGKPLSRRANAKQRASKSVVGSTVLIALVMAGLALALPTAIVLFVGFLPTLAAWLVDNTPRRYATKTVLGVNFAGVAPFVLKLWSGQNDIAAAGRIVTDPFALVVMLGAAAIGWMMFLGFPSLVTALSTLNAARRIGQLKEHQRALTEEWGAAVAAPERRDPQLEVPPQDPPAFKQSNAA